MTKEALQIVVAYLQSETPIEDLLHDFNQDMSDQMRGRGMAYHAAHWLGAYKILCYSQGVVPQPTHLIHSGEYDENHCGTFADVLAQMERDS